jgi:hypothetical protein
MARYTINTPDGRSARRSTARRTSKSRPRSPGRRRKRLTFDAGSLTVGEWLDRWLRDAVADTVRPVTFAKYEQIVRNHAKPALR